MMGGGNNQLGAGFGARPLIIIEDPDDIDLHEEDDDEKAADVIETIKQASELQEQTHNSPFQVNQVGLGSSESNIPDDYALAEVPEEVEPEKEKVITAQTAAQPLKLEEKKSTALSMFATVLAITGLGLAIWFNFSD